MEKYSPLAKADIILSTGAGSENSGGGLGTGGSVVVIDPPYKWYDDLTGMVFCGTKQVECNWDVIPCFADIILEMLDVNGRMSAFSVIDENSELWEGV